MSPKQKCHQNWIVTKTEMSPKLKCHQNWNVTKAAMSPKLKCHINWNVTKTNMLPKLKFHKNQNQGDWHWSPCVASLSSLPIKNLLIDWLIGLVCILYINVHSCNTNSVRELLVFKHQFALFNHNISSICSSLDICFWILITEFLL